MSIFRRGSALSATSVLLRPLLHRPSSSTLLLANAAAASSPTRILMRCFSDGTPHLDTEVPDPERTLMAIPRGPKKEKGEERNDDFSNGFGRNYAARIRERGRIPAVLCGDRLPFVHITVCKKELAPFVKRTHFQRELMTLQIEGGEKVKCLVQEVTYKVSYSDEIEHIHFRRWPREPKKNPIKLGVPLISFNDKDLPTIKAGGYVMDIFAQKGLPVRVRNPNHIPRFFLVDMKKHRNNSVYFDAIKDAIPPGVTIQKTVETQQNGGNFLVMRGRRVRFRG